MPYSSLQRLIIVARKQLNLPAASDAKRTRHAYIPCDAGATRQRRVLCRPALCPRSLCNHSWLPAAFLPDSYPSDSIPPLSQQKRRAIWAITNCRTPALGGRSFACERCGQVHFAFHSCNHKACPQCGREATARWIDRELGKLVVPSFRVCHVQSPNRRRRGR